MLQQTPKPFKLFQRTYLYQFKLPNKVPKSLQFSQ